jgi:hypothetical protein
VCNAGDVSLNVGVNRGYDLGSLIGAPEIDLVTVVLGRVVARCHHHPDICLEVSNRESENRGRELFRQQDGFNAVAGKNGGSVLRENRRVCSCIAPYDCAKTTPSVTGVLFQKVVRQARCGLCNDDAVHTGGAGLKWASDTSCSKTEAIFKQFRD